MPRVGRSPFGAPYPSLEFYNGSIYVLGYSYIAHIFGIEKGNDLFRYDLDGGYWEVVEVFGDIPQVRLEHYSAIYKNEMYINFGFIQELFLEYHDCYKFNFESRAWHNLTLSIQLTELLHQRCK